MSSDTTCIDPEKLASDKIVKETDKKEVVETQKNTSSEEISTEDITFKKKRTLEEAEKEDGEPSESEEPTKKKLLISDDSEDKDSSLVGVNVEKTDKKPIDQNNNTNKENLKLAEDKTTTTTTEKDKNEDSKETTEITEKDKDKEDKQSSPKLEIQNKEKPKFVFGLTTPFGTTPAFSFFTDKKKKPTFGAGEGNPLDQTESITETKSTTTSSDSEKSTSVKPVFGGGSTFGNAFKIVMNKKSIFDQTAEEVKEKSEEKESETESSKLSTPSSKDPVYQKVHLEKKSISTGEEGEKTLFGAKSKLYYLDLTDVSQGWKEKGVGILRLNNSSDGKYRLLMRADATLKAILNVPIVKGFEVYKGMESSMNGEKFLRFNFVENDIPVQYAVRFGQSENTSKLFDLIKEIS